MIARGLIRHPLSIMLIACAVLPLLLSACQPVSETTSPPPVEPIATIPPAQQPTATQLPTGEPVSLSPQTPAQATKPPSSTTVEITLDLTRIAQDQTVETVEAVPASDAMPSWGVGPEYRRVTLQGYPVSEHLMEPQIFIYPVGDLASANEYMGKIAGDLQTLLQNQQTGENLPFLPLFNAGQMMHAQVQYLDIKNDKGVRFLTQFAQAPLRISNFELIYTFQGLTSDGKYYIAAVLPVTHPDLPATSDVFSEDAAEMSNYPAYMAETVTWMEQQSDESFTPDLAKLDALIQSIEVK